MTMITREDAVATLNEVIASGILAEDIEDCLQDIASCIEAERIGRHEWGVSRDKLGVLYSAVRQDLITEERMSEYDDIHKQLTFIPSIDERTLIETNIADRIENATGEEVDGKEIERWFERF